MGASATTIRRDTLMTDTPIPVVFIHGLWLHPLSWTEWAGLFQAAGYRTMAPGWPGVPDTVQAARANPDSGVTVAELEA
jgi:hypothetical protein